MAILSSTLAWKIPRMEEPGGLQSMGSLRVGHDCASSLHFQVGKVSVCCPQAGKHRDPRPGGTRRLMMLTPLTSPSANQKNAHKLIMPSLNHYYKTPHSPLQVGTHSFEGISPLYPSLPAKATKLLRNPNSLCLPHDRQVNLRQSAESKIQLYLESWLIEKMAE